jgi:2-dehydropantoate 2-reductase
MEPIHILGAGSIGLTFAANIRSAFPSYPLSLLLRDHHKHKIDDDDEVMVCLIKSGKPRMVPVPAQLISSQRKRPIKTLLLTTKAFAAANAVKSILPRFDEHSVSFIVLCNGAFAVKTELLKMSSEIPANIEFILATTTHGAYTENSSDDMYHVVHAGEGKTFIEEHASISQLFDQSWLNSKSISKEEMNVMLWQKLAANCAINPLTALLNCENGGLLDPTIVGNELPCIDAIVQEVSEVAKADTSSKVDSDSPLLTLLDYTSLKAFVDTVIKDTLYNKSSMLQDILKQQQTEVEYLNGYVSLRGREFGIDTPANDELCQRIEKLTKTFQ